MKNKRYLVFLILFGFLFINNIFSTSVRAEDLTPLLTKITNRSNSYPENNNIQYTIVQKITEMDKHWKPKKTTVIKTIRKLVDGIPSGEILEAVETEDGASTDIKQKAMEQMQKEMDQINKQRAEQKAQNKIQKPFEELLPFYENKYAMYEFKRLNDDTYNERPVFIIEATAKEKDEKLLEGKYYIDKKTYDVLKAQIKPSQKPNLVKEMDMDIEFQVLPEGNFVINRMKVRADGGLLFMRMRVIQEGERYDYKILN